MGGVLSTLLWILHVNRVVEETQRELQGIATIPRREWSVIFRIFADDISAAISRKTRKGAIILPQGLSEALLEVLTKLDLGAARPERNNFLVEGNNKGKPLEIEGDECHAKRRATEKIQREAGAGSDPRPGNGGEEKAEKLPFTWAYSFKLLGVALDCKRNFGQHLIEARAKACRRFRVLTKVGDAAWGMES